MKVLFRLAIRNIKRKKLRFFILFLTFMLSTLTLMSAIFFKDTAVRTRENQLRDNTINSQLVIKSGNNQNLYFSPDEILEKLKAVTGIRYVTTRCGGTANNERTNNSINLVGVNFEEQNKIYPFSLLSQCNIPIYEEKIIISNTYSKENKLKLGDKIGAIFNNNKMCFTVGGIAEDKGVFENSNIAFIPIKDAQKLFSQEGKVYTIGITLEKLDEITDVSKNINKLLTPDMLIEQKYDLEFFKAYIGTISLALSIFGAFSLLIAIYLTYSTYKTFLYERLTQVGTLRSIGVSKKQIYISIYLENLIVVFVSTLLGVAVSIPILRKIIMLVVNNSADVEISYIKVLLVVISLIAIGLISISYSIYKMMKIPIMNIIKGEFINYNIKKSPVKHIIGITMLAAAILLFFTGDKYKNGLAMYIIGISLFMVSFIILLKLIHFFINTYIFRVLNLVGPEMRLLLKEFKRDFAKSAESLTVICIVIAIAYLSLNISYMVKDSVNKVYNGIDITLTTDGSLRDDLSKKIFDIQGIEQVTTQLRAYKKVNNMDVEISGINPRIYSLSSFEIVKSGDKKNLFNTLENGRSIIITTTFAKNTNTKLNDFILINNNKYKVVGIVSSFENMGKVLFISNNNFKKDLVYNDYWIYLIKIKNDYKVQSIMDKINSSLA